MSLRGDLGHPKGLPKEGEQFIGEIGGGLCAESTAKDELFQVPSLFDRANFRLLTLTLNLMF